MKNIYSIKVEMPDDTFIYKFDAFNLFIIQVLITGYEMERIGGCTMTTDFTLTFDMIQAALSQIQKGIIKDYKKNQ